MKVMSPSSDTIYVRTSRVTLLDYWKIWSHCHRSSFRFHRPSGVISVIFMSPFLLSAHYRSDHSFLFSSSIYPNDQTRPELVNSLQMFSSSLPFTLII